MSNGGGRPGIVTVQQHIIEDQRAHPTASGEFSMVLSGIALATRIIADRIRRAGLVGVLGSTGRENVQGEVVQKLDHLANEVFLECLGYRDSVAILVSEEEDEPRPLREGRGKYIVLIDPVDGSGNIDVNVSVGTIFSILQVTADSGGDFLGHCLQPGVHQVAAGYVMYGGSTVMVYTTGQGVHLATLDPAIGAYVLHDEHVMMPERGATYSVNEAYASRFSEGVRRYLDRAKADGYSLRYVGSLVADFHRTLLRGGVFLYPPTAQAPDGKLRLLYEANPLAFLAEQAGGRATDGCRRILDKTPARLHERTGLIIGSRAEVDRVMSFLASD